MKKDNKKEGKSMDERRRNSYLLWKKHHPLVNICLPTVASIFFALLIY